MTCREISEFLMSYLANELSLRRRTAFEQHLAECPECVAYLEGYKATIELGKAAFADEDAEAPGSVPEDLVQAILRATREKDR
jgi:anti-sigma factor RsiW